MTAIFTCSPTWRQITDTSFHCVECRHVCVNIGWCVWVSQTEIRRKPFNYTPEQGPAFSFFITTTSLLFHWSDSLPLRSPHLSIFFFCLYSVLPLHRASVPLEFLNITFPFWFHVPIAPYLPISLTHYISPRACFYLPSSQRISQQQILKSLFPSCSKVISK